MRIVLDTNTVISGLFWRGKPFQVLELMRLGRIKVYTSGAILEELLDVLNRPKFSTRLALLGFSPQEVVNSLMSWVEVVEIGEVEKIVISDPDDDQIIACAKLGLAEKVTEKETNDKLANEVRRVNQFFWRKGVNR
ncbi:hypothetical protein PL8927_600043 [Planktothrix serta PCC 8927]|uniref:PIN domain-containing protein n=1 Tax=Planktothrix serta PCC 8927 TaxID=671068 RepID=A0A7Z9BPK1_9CYAN|nr:putative toxin-antitoxin system toxin component, PIN family [Planktothrix serta]VXD17644.1 hypothetical protein PL8927_600043 [Planktothrix serta PCC 8927]